MKNKSAVLFSAALVALLSIGVYAASGVRGAKSATVISQQINIVGVSSGPAVLYGVVVGTGTAGTDFVVFFDSNSVGGLALGSQSKSDGYRMRINASSATQATVVTFDPPLQFKNGIMAANSAATLSSLVSWESGRVSQGY